MSRKWKLVFMGGIICCIFGACLTMIFPVLFCPFFRLTSVPCPFCGLARSWLSLAAGDWTGAFHYHPLTFFLIVVTSIFVVRFVVQDKTRFNMKGVSYGAFLITLTHWVQNIIQTGI